MKIILTSALFFFLSLNLDASKVINSESYLKNSLSEKVIALGEKIEKAHETLQLIQYSDTNSLVKTDFWGMKPAWYVSDLYGTSITTNYPYSESWIRATESSYERPWYNHRANLVRNINGVILNPIDSRYIRDTYKKERARGWRKKLKVFIDFSPNYNSSSYYLSYLKQYFTENGVGDLNKALTYFGSKVEPATNLINQSVFNKFDMLIKGSISGSVTEYNNIGSRLERDKKLDLEKFIHPSKHLELFTQEVFKEYDRVFHPSSSKKYASQFEDDYKNKSLFDYYKSSDLTLEVEVPIQFFIVGKYLNKNAQYNQLQKLKEMLDEMEKSGKVKKFQENSLTIYEDKAKLQSRIAINYENGFGYWQLPIWNIKYLLDKQIKEIEVLNKELNDGLKRYLELCAEETVRQFKSNGVQTSGF